MLSAALFCLTGPSAPQTRQSRALQRTPATYYVDSIQGNDDDAGTSPNRAWKSLAKVNATTFLPGDRILLKSGAVWRGQLWPKGSGAEGRPIMLDMYGGGVKPVIHGDGLAEDAVLLKNQEYWEIRKPRGHQHRFRRRCPPRGASSPGELR